MKIPVVMSILLILILGIGAILWLSGSDAPSTKRAAEHVVATEKVLPEDFYETAFTRSEPPMFQYEVGLADDEDRYEQLWGYYQLSGERPEIDFQENNVLFLGVQESGSCPLEVTSVQIEGESDDESVRLTLKAEGRDACTDDATPRTFVLKLDKEESKALKTAVVVDGDTETAVPLVEPGITGYVTKVDAATDRILVVGSNPHDFSATGGDPEFYDAIWFSEAPRGVEVGNQVMVWFDEVMTSYPGQSTVKQLQVLYPLQPMGASRLEQEVVREALETEEFEGVPVVLEVAFDRDAGEWLVVLKDEMVGETVQVIVED